jgi:hypothetical protein
MANPIKVVKKSCKLSITHDRMSLTVKFTNGEVLKVSLTRSGERITVEGFADRAIAKKQMEVLTKNFQHREEENNEIRFNRYKECGDKSNSLADFCINSV